MSWAEETAAIRRAAEDGDAHAQFRLGRFMILRRIASTTPGEAMRWIEASCKQRYPLALLFQASLSALGIERPQSYDDAIRFVALAAAGGYERAQGQLQVLGGVRAFNAQDWVAPAALEKHFEEPRIFTAEAFLPQKACAWLISQSRSRLQAAPVKDPMTGQSAVSGIRSNSGCGFSSIEADLVLQLANIRIANTLGLPVLHQETTNVLHYAVGQEYRAHYDFVTEEDEGVFARELQELGQRAATCLIYLNDNFAGGETGFPRLTWRYKGKAGDALIFWNLSEQGEREKNSLHAGCPVTAGQKWLYSKWVRTKPQPLS